MDKDKEEFQVWATDWGMVIYRGFSDKETTASAYAVENGELQYYKGKVYRVDKRDREFYVREEDVRWFIRKDAKKITKSKFEKLHRMMVDAEEQCHAWQKKFMDKIMDKLNSFEQED